VAQGLQFSTALTATTSGGAVAFTSPDSTSGRELRATRVVLINAGSTSAAGVHINLTTTSGASTDDFQLAPSSYTATTGVVPPTPDRGVSIDAPRGGFFTGFSYVVSSAGNTVPLRVVAIR
jgi:hypothetical protein